VAKKGPPEARVLPRRPIEAQIEGPLYKPWKEFIKSSKTDRDPSSIIRQCDIKSISIKTAKTMPTDFDRYDPCYIPRYPVSNGLVVFRTSDKIIGHACPTSAMRVPYINKIGMITSHLLGVWKCSYHQLFCTLVATVYKRLYGAMRRHNKKHGIANCYLFQVAFCYVISNDVQWFLRTYGLMKHQPKALKNYLYYKLKHMDAGQRFLFAQMDLFILWVQSGPRKLGSVKSIHKQKRVDLLSESARLLNNALFSSMDLYSMRGIDSGRLNISLTMSKMYNLFVGTLSKRKGKSKTL